MTDPRLGSADDADDDLHLAGLDADGAAHRLRLRARWASLGVALTSLLPYEIVDGKPQFVWSMLGELSTAGVVACFAPLVAGLTVFVAGLRLRRPSSLAALTLGALAASYLVVRLGADAAAWELLPLPESIGRRHGWALLALAMVGAGAPMAFRPHARRVANGLLLGALGLAFAFYLWPGRGEAPISTVVRTLSRLDVLPDWRFKLGFIVVAVLVLWPGIIALLGVRFVRWPPKDDHPVLAIAALYGLPLMLAMFVFRALPGAPEGWSVFTVLGGILVLAATVALLASGIEVAAEAALAPDPEADPPPEGLAPRRALAYAAIAALVCGLGQWALARPPAKGVEWTLVAATPAADAVFERLLPAWNRARLAWDRQAREASGARALQEVEAAAKDLREGAEAVDPALGAAVARLTTEARDLHVAGRRWYQLVADLNETVRTLGLPYYLDPTVYVFKHGDGLRRHFRMRTYRVERVGRFRAGGDDFATLHVRRLDRRGPDGRRLLGFSRDLQRFAIVQVDELEDFEGSLFTGAAHDPPRCDEPERYEAQRGLERCGELLAKVVEEAETGLGEGLALLTERHELQHQIDGPHLAMSGAVLDRLAGRAEGLQNRVNRELSAYVAQMTAPQAAPRLGLIHLVRFVLNGDPRHHLYHVAVIAFEALVDRGLTDSDGVADLDAVVAAFVELATLDDAALRVRAAEAWADLYGGGLPEVEILEVSRPPEGA